MRNVNNRENGGWSEEKQGISEGSLLSAQLFCKPETALKIKPIMKRREVGKGGKEAGREGGTKRRKVGSRDEWCFLIWTRRKVKEKGRARRALRFVSLEHLGGVGCVLSSLILGTASFPHPHDLWQWASLSGTFFAWLHHPGCTWLGPGEDTSLTLGQLGSKDRFGLFQYRWTCNFMNNNDNQRPSQGLYEQKIDFATFKDHNLFSWRFCPIWSSNKGKILIQISIV